LDGLLERGLHGAALSEDGGGQVGLAAVTVVLGSSALVAGADGVPVVGVVVERGESVAQRFEVVEDVRGGGLDDGADDLDTVGALGNATVRPGDGAGVGREADLQCLEGLADILGSHSLAPGAESERVSSDCSHRNLLTFSMASVSG